MTTIEKLKQEFPEDRETLKLIDSVSEFICEPEDRDWSLNDEKFTPNPFQQANILKCFFEVLLSDEELDYYDEVLAWNISWGGVKSYLLAQDGSEIGPFTKDSVKLPNGFANTEKSNAGEIDIVFNTNDIHVLTLNKKGQLSHKITPFFD